jgi:hypothetical protein
VATPKEDNPLWMLRTFYFVPCDLMHQHFLYHLRKDPGRAPEECITFMLYWLASLFVVADGWKSLKISEPTIDRIIDTHWGGLRRFRNAVFHFHLHDRKQIEFFTDVAKFNWAEDLHSALRTYFEAQDHMPG